jgi:hypothetical protein
MNILYEGKDILEYTDLISGVYRESSGGRLDSLHLVFSDSKKLWSKWKPKQNDKIQVISDAADTGVLFIDTIAMNNGEAILKALPIKKEMKSPKTVIYEEIGLNLLGASVAKEMGFEFKSYGVENHTYKRMEQLSKSNLSFLNERAVLEGVAVKIYNQQLILYSEENFESKAFFREISADEGFKFDFQTGSKFADCKLINNDITASFHSLKDNGATLVLETISFSDSVEGTRFSKGLLRQQNKLATQLILHQAKFGNIPTGVVLSLTDFGLPDGQYFVDQREVNLLTDLSKLSLRRPLEGY